MAAITLREHLGGKGFGDQIAIAVGDGARSEEAAAAPLTEVILVCRPCGTVLGPLGEPFVECHPGLPPMRTLRANAVFGPGLRVVGCVELREEG
jgi:hypothetical protein